MRTLLIASACLCASMSFAQSIMVVSGTPSDFVSGGKTMIFTNLKAAPEYGQWTRGIAFSMPGKVTEWSANFSAPGNQLIQKGVYDFTARFPFEQSYQPGLDVTGDGRGCNGSKGEYTVYQVDYNKDGSLKDFAANFVQHCEDGASAMYGALRYNSNVPISFGMTNNV